MIKVLHVFDSYLPKSQVWLYNLLKHTPCVDHFIAADEYLDNNFFDVGSFINKSWITRRKHETNFSLAERIIRRLSKTALLFSLNQKKIIEKEITSNNYDAIHFHFAPTACNYINTISKINKPVFVSFYGYDYKYIPTINPDYIILYQKLFSLPCIFLTEGNHSKEYLIKEGCNASNIKIQPLSVDVNNISKTHRTKSKNHLNLVQIANFKTKKGHIYTIKAFHQSLLLNHNITLTFVGQGDKRSTLDEVLDYVNYHNLSNHVRFIEWCEYNNLHNFLHEFHVFIHPSLHAPDGDCEGGAPIILLDAQATGLPVISTFHCDIPSEVIHYRTGVLCKERDIECLTRAIIYFSSMSQEEYSRFSLNAKAHIKNEFDIVKSGFLLFEKYKFSLYD